MGIDPSINSTGVCITSNNKDKYTLIPGKMTKKMQNFKSDYINIICYNKTTPLGDGYGEKEYIKTCNIYSICEILENLIISNNVTHVNMEGISYGSVGSAALADLAGLNFAIRCMLKRNNIPFTIIPPTGLKKFAVANGSADKDLMVFAWRSAQPHINKITDIKVDDLADSYFLAHYKNP